MLKVNRFVLTAAVAACASLTARAAEPSPASPAPIYAQQDAAPALRPLMSLLDKAGAADTLTDARIDVYGHVEGSWTHSFDDPAGGLLLGRVFDFQHDDPTLNQIDLNVERKVDLTAGSFDLGGRLELLYGGDARFIHSNGIGDGDDFFSGPDNQLDLTQAYLDFALPVGGEHAMRLRVGKFLFFKQIDPNASVFYSHSYTFGAALPFTLSGVSAYYEMGDQWSFEGGVNRGWGQSLEDNNDSVSFHGRVTYRPGERTSMSVLAITGPELDDNEQDWRTAIDFVIRHELNDKTTALLDVVYGMQNNVTADDTSVPSAIGDDAWYGVAGYLVYALNEQVSVGGRLEWFHDEGGFTTGVDQNLYEATLGVTLTPFAEDELGQNLKIRPEVRYDYSDNDFFDGLTANSQFTFAIDAVFNF
jgi:hypothetical protein